MKPMLAGTIEDRAALKYPVIVSPKLDGVRALVKDGVVLSRSLKPIPNKYVQRMFGKAEYEGFDGELIVGSITAQDACRATVSGVMSPDGEPDVTYCVFDLWNQPNDTFWDRYDELQNMSYNKPHIKVVGIETANNIDQLNKHEEEVLAAGFEGLMVRDAYSPYKYGRSSVKQGYLLKLKRFHDSEAIIIGFTELQHNHNTKETNELGRTKRSTKKAGKVGGDTLGALVVKDIKSGVQFEIGTGFDAALRKEIWDNKHSYMEKLVKYKCMEAGTKDKPRHPVFISFRDKRDM